MQQEFVSEHGGFFLTLKNLDHRLFQKGDEGDVIGRQNQNKLTGITEYRCLE